MSIKSIKCVFFGFSEQEQEQQGQTQNRKTMRLVSQYQ